MSIPTATAAAWRNTADAFAEQALARPQADALITPLNGGGYAKTAYAELDALANAHALRLQAAGIGRGERVLLALRPGLNLTALTFALMRLGAVPVFIDPGMGKAGLLNCVRSARASALIGLPRAVLASMIERRAFAGLRLRLVADGWLPPSPWWRRLDALPVENLRFERLAMEPDDLAAILFTSGSTGPAKGVEYTHGMFLTQIRLIRETYGVTEKDVDMSVFALFALFAVSMGMASVIPAMDTSRPAAADPQAVLRVIDECGVTFSFGSPTFWGKMARHCQAQGRGLPSLRAVVMAGCSVEPWLHRLLLQDILPPGAQVHVPYGATESLPLCSMEGAAVLAESAAATAAGAGTCVGAPVAPALIQVRIMQACPEPLPELREDMLLPPGQIGEVIACGPVVSRAYFDNAQANASSKMLDSQGRLWHRIGDLAYLDEAGRLWFCGRHSELIRLDDGRRLYTDCIEQVFATHPKVLRCALIARRSTGASHGRTRAVLCVMPVAKQDSPERCLALAQHILHYGWERSAACTGVDGVIFWPGTFPVDVRHNAKIKRDILTIKTQALPVWPAAPGP